MNLNLNLRQIRKIRWNLYGLWTDLGGKWESAVLTNPNNTDWFQWKSAVFHCLCPKSSRFPENRWILGGFNQNFKTKDLLQGTVNTLVFVVFLNFECFSCQNTVYHRHFIFSTFMHLCSACKPTKNCIILTYSLFILCIFITQYFHFCAIFTGVCCFQMLSLLIMCIKAIIS